MSSIKTLTINPHPLVCTGLRWLATFSPNFSAFTTFICFNFNNMFNNFNGQTLNIFNIININIIIFTISNDNDPTYIPAVCLTLPLADIFISYLLLFNNFFATLAGQTSFPPDGVFDGSGRRYLFFALPWQLLSPSPHLHFKYCILNQLIL